MRNFSYGAVYMNQIPATGDIPADYARQEIALAKKCKCHHMFFFVDFDGLMIYPSGFVPQVERLKGRDLLAELVSESHKAKLNFTACWMGMHVQTYLGREHPDWQLLSIEEYRNQQQGRMGALCINSPHREILLNQFEEVIRNYGVQGIYQDGLYFPEPFCFCRYCREKYRNTFGKEMPAELLDQSRAKLREESLVSYAREVRKVIDKTDPEVFFFLDCHGSIIGMVDSREAIHRTCEFADSYMLECYYEIIKEQPYYVGMETQLVKSETGRLVISPKWIAKNPDSDCVGLPEAGIKLWAFQALMNQALPAFINQNVTGCDIRTVRTAGKVFGDIEKLRPVLKDAKKIKYAALVHSLDTKLNTLPYKPREHRQYFEGFYQLLLSAGIPFDVISEKDILKGGLKDYRTVILPNVRFMNDEVSNAVEEYVRSGGGVVMTCRTSLEDENGRERGDFSLGKTAGIRFIEMRNNKKKYGIERAITHYYRVTKRHFITEGLSGRTYSFNGNIDYAGVELLPGTEVILGLAGYDEKLVKSGNFFISYPSEGISGDPVVVIRKGKGRAVSVLAPLDRIFWEYGWPELYDILSRAVIWSAGAKPIVEIGCPKTVHTAIFEKGDTVTILLLNYTTNQLYSIGFPGYYTAKTEQLGRGWPVQFCVPLSDIKISIQSDSRKIKRIWTLSGQKVKFEKGGRKPERLGSILTLPKLDEYEAITVEYQAG